jgi:hypothetical protein
MSATADGQCFGDGSNGPARQVLCTPSAIDRVGEDLANGS